MSRTYRRKANPKNIDYNRSQYISIGADKEYDKEKYFAKTFVYKDGRRERLLTEKEYVYHSSYGTIVGQNSVRRVFFSFEDTNSGVHRPPKVFRNILERKHRRRTAKEIHKWTKAEDYVVLLEKNNVEDDLWWSWF